MQKAKSFTRWDPNDFPEALNEYLRTHPNEKITNMTMLHNGVLLVIFEYEEIK